MAPKIVRYNFVPAAGSGSTSNRPASRACQRAAWRAGHKVKEERNPLRTAASSSSPASSSASPGPGRGAGGPIEAPTPATVAATSSDSSSRDSTLKETTKPSKPKTNTTNTKGPAAVSDEQFPATETKAENKNNKKKRGEKTMWVAIFQCFNCGKRGHDLTKCTRCEETCTHCSTTSSSPLSPPIAVNAGIAIIIRHTTPVQRHMIITSTIATRQRSMLMRSCLLNTT